MKCPNCGKELEKIGIVGNGAAIYRCDTCGVMWEIKEYEPEY